MKLVIAPNTILKSKATDWVFLCEQDYTNAETVEKEMIELMLASNGIGLAANQVGLIERVFAIQLSSGQQLCMFNPKVIATSDNMQLGQEGCLSFPNLWLDIERPQSIVAEYLDKTAKERTITLSGIDARCFLHELDHLDGICFTEKTSALKLALAKKKQQKKRKFV